MADGARDLSPRVSIDDQSMEESIVYEVAFHHFRRYKVEISNAIKKTFPFLEGLRDRELITNKMFEDFQDSCRNLVPVQRVIYAVLNELEKKFNLAILEALFSEVNMQEYPDLIHVQKSFSNAIQDRLYSQEGNEEESEERLEQGTSPLQNGFLESLHETEQRNKKRKVTTSDETEAQGSQGESAQESELEEAGEQVAALVNDGDANLEAPSPAPCNEEKTEPSSSGIQMASCSVRLVDIKKEKPFFPWEVERQARARTNHYHASDIIVISSEESDLSDREEPPADSVSYRASPVFSNCDLLEPYEGEESQEATCSQQISPEPLDFKNSPTIRKNLKKREREDDQNSPESREEGMAPVPCSSALRGELGIEVPTGSRKISTWKIHNRKRSSSSSGSSELGHGEESQESLRSGSGEKRRHIHKANHLQIGKKRDEPEISTPSKEVPKKRGWPKGKKRGSLKIHTTLSNEVPRKRGWPKGKKRGSPKIRTTLSNEVPRKGGWPKGKKRGSHKIHITLSNEVPRKGGWPKGRKRINSRKRGKKRVQRIPKDANLHLPELPVTCGTAKGTLYKEKLKKGIQEKSIESEDGRWFTPREFEIEGKLGASKNWRMSVRCYRCPLKYLIKKKYLQDPPRKRKKCKTPESCNNILVDPYPENSNECEVCCQGGLIFCCDTCSKSYHEDCHIPPVDTERNPWSCILCRTKAIRKRCRESQPCHQESEVLRRHMLPEEQLICELLLLKVYCSSESAFFAPEPYYSREALQGPQEHMWLNKIKERLNKKEYPRVEGFVRDMRLIFQNHKAFYKGHKFIRLVINIEANFEKNFKKIFAIQ